MVVCVIEEKIKVFDLIKNILKASGGKDCIFLYGNADFSADIRKYIAENDILIFRYINPALLLNLHLGEHLSYYSNIIDLAVVGECGKYMDCIDILRLGHIKSVLLNIENSGGVNPRNNDIQVITCGLKEKDTVIFSSINLDEQTVILDLQRSIKNIKDEIVEPFEKQINIPEFILNEKTEDLILSLTALTCCGRI